MLKYTTTFNNLSFFFFKKRTLITSDNVPKIILSKDSSSMIPIWCKKAMQKNSDIDIWKGREVYQNIK